MPVIIRAVHVKNKYAPPAVSCHRRRALPKYHKRPPMYWANRGVYPHPGNKTGRVRLYVRTCPCRRRRVLLIYHKRPPMYWVNRSVYHHPGNKTGRVRLYVRTCLFPAVLPMYHKRPPMYWVNRSVYPHPGNMTGRVKLYVRTCLFPAIFAVYCQYTTSARHCTRLPVAYPLTLGTRPTG